MVTSRCFANIRTQCCNVIFHSGWDRTGSWDQFRLFTGWWRTVMGFWSCATCNAISRFCFDRCLVFATYFDWFQLVICSGRLLTLQFIGRRRFYTWCNLNGCVTRFVLSSTQFTFWTSTFNIFDCLSGLFFSSTSICMCAFWIVYEFLRKKVP